MKGGNEMLTQVAPPGGWLVALKTAITVSRQPGQQGPPPDVTTSHDILSTCLGGD